MIIGEYPCCDGPLLLEMPERRMYVKDECEHCKATVWHYLAWGESMSWTEKDFHEAFDVDEETKEITPRNALNVVSEQRSPFIMYIEDTEPSQTFATFSRDHYLLTFDEVMDVVAKRNANEIAHLIEKDILDGNQ